MFSQHVYHNSITFYENASWVHLKLQCFLLKCRAVFSTALYTDWGPHTNTDTFLLKSNTIYCSLVLYFALTIFFFSLTVLNKNCLIQGSKYYDFSIHVYKLDNQFCGLTQCESLTYNCSKLLFKTVAAAAADYYVAIIIENRASDFVTGFL